MTYAAKLTWWVLLFSVAAMLIVGWGAAASSSVPVGIWKGRIVQRPRTYTIPSIALVVTAHGIKSSVTGLTGAAHDSPTPSRLSPTGYVEGSPCGAPGKRSPGWTGYLLRLHPPKGGKLAVEVTTWDQAPKSLAETISMLKDAAAAGHLGWRGYLTH